MTFRQTTLPSGIRVVSDRMPDTRSAAVGFWIGVGSRDERPHEAGCSHFLEHLLFKGTARRSAQDIAEELDAVGGELNAFTAKEHTCFYARVLDRDLALAVDVLGDMLGNAKNTAEDVDAEREVVLEEINIHLDSPDDLVHSDFSVGLLPGHRLGLETLGTVDGIRAMARDTIHEYFERTYRPGNVVVSAAGNIEHDHLVELVAALGDLGRPGEVDVVRDLPAGLAGGSVSIRHKPTEQAHVVLGGRGLPSGDERRYAMRVLDTVLGGGMSSRLFQQIREQRGLAYTTYSYASSFTDTGTYGAYAGTTPAKVIEVLDLISAQLDGIADDITVAEIERAKGSLCGGMVLGLEDTGSRMSRLGMMVMSEGELLTVDDTIARIDAVVPDDVRAVARELLSATRVLSVVGPFEAGDDRFAKYVA